MVEPNKRLFMTAVIANFQFVGIKYYFGRNRRQRRAVYRQQMTEQAVIRVVRCVRMFRFRGMVVFAICGGGMGFRLVGNLQPAR